MKVEDGKFSEITVTPKEGYDEGNASYFNKAYSKTKGFKTKLEGQAATEDTINSWDTVSPVQHVLLMQLKKLHLKQSSQLR